MVHIAAAVAAALTLTSCARWVVDSVDYTGPRGTGSYSVTCVDPNDPDQTRTVPVDDDHGLNPGDPCPTS